MPCPFQDGEKVPSCTGNPTKRKKKKQQEVGSYNYRYSQMKGTAYEPFRHMVLLSTLQREREREREREEGGTCHIKDSI